MTSSQCDPRCEECGCLYCRCDSTAQPAQAEPVSQQYIREQAAKDMAPVYAAFAAPPPPPQPAPIDMVLHCPACGLQHIDAPDTEFYGGMTDAAGFHPRWDNPPHRSHLCAGCGHIWRPADVPTNGVQAVKTKGKDDSPGVNLTPAQQRITRDAVQAHAAARLNLPAAPGMAAQALGCEIVDALLADGEDGGYDLTGGVFGPAFSKLVRRWAALEYAKETT